jgi:hypothetical protein
MSDWDNPSYAQGPGEERGQGARLESLPPIPGTTCRPARRLLPAGGTGGCSGRQFLEHPALGLDREEQGDEAADQCDYGEGQEDVADAEVGDDEADQEGADG